MKTSTIESFDHALMDDLDDMIQRLSNAGFPQAASKIHNVYCEIETRHRQNQATDSHTDFDYKMSLDSILLWSLDIEDCRTKGILDDAQLEVQAGLMYKQLQLNGMGWDDLTNSLSKHLQKIL